MPSAKPTPHRPTRARASGRVVVPKPSSKRFYGHGIPGVDPDKLIGKLIVVEGADGSGRSTLVSEELEQAQKGNILSHITMSLFYATDFADQLENIILPALKAGFMVLADRYIYTLMVRDLVRGADEQWVRDLYGIALVPDAVFYLNVSSQTLVQRTFAKNSALDYWESGMDLGLSRDMFDSFLKYQARVQDQFKRLQATYGFTMVDGERSVEDLNAELQHKIESILAGR